MKDDFNVEILCRKCKKPFEKIGAINTNKNPPEVICEQCCLTQLEKCKGGKILHINFESGEVKRV